MGDPTMMTSSLPPSRPSRWTARLMPTLQALPHDLRCQVLRQRSRRRLRGDEDRRGHDWRRPPEGPDGVKVNISWQVFSHQSIENRITRKKPHSEEFPSDDPATWYCHPLTCVEAHIHSVKNHHRHHQSEILHWDQ